MIGPGGVYQLNSREEAWLSVCFQVKALLIPKSFSIPKALRRRPLVGLLLCISIMGNEISHKRWCFGNCKNSERQEAEQGSTEADPPMAQKAPMALLWNSVNHPPEEKPPDTAAGTQNKDTGRESEKASSSLQHVQKPVVRIMVQTTQLQDSAEAQPSAELSQETENKVATLLSPDRQTHAPTRERPATAEPAVGDTRVTKAYLPLRAAAETGARDAQDTATDQATAASNSLVCKRPSDKLCKHSPLCRWLKKLKSSAEKSKAKPDAITSQE
ncbi:uncharacterized protein LOC112968940 [Apteryx rowi]|uniref:uncharacterized protein LOC112968940 n=1 Tax=Apteryx rowi TaxID=308060 RepID=UPI000E1CDCDC|nr:uncharacterized protein LOC112968940 [Apteryx rowi]